VEPPSPPPPGRGRAREAYRVRGRAGGRGEAGWRGAPAEVMDWGERRGGGEKRLRDWKEEKRERDSARV